MLNFKIIQQEYGIGFAVSLGLHVLMGSFLILSIQQGVSSEVLANQKGDIVQAVIIDENRVVAEVQRIKIEQQQQKTAAEAEITKAHEARKAREQEQVKLDKLKQDIAHAKVQETERLTEIKIAKEKEKKQLESLRQEKEKEKKRLVALDEERQAEQDRVNQVRAQREKEEKKKEELKRQSEAGMKAAALAAENRSRIMSEAERILGEWKISVRNNKRETLELAPELSCTLSIALLPDGSFHEVRIVESSGNPVFDDSVMHAIYKTPVAMPDDLAVRDELKHFTLRYTNIE